MTSANFTYPTSLPSLTLSETGSSLLYPLFNLWVNSSNSNSFTGMYSSVKINTASTGSGTGQADSEQGTVQIGASDAYLSNTTAAQFPMILNIPLAISAQQINYNLPMIPATMHLNFTGTILTDIYNGTITKWNDPAIVAVNPGAASLLPDSTIIPVHRADGSGDTFIFTTYLSDTDPWWATNVGFATTVSWPAVQSGQSATGNGGMVTFAEQNEYSIAYIGISYLNSAISGKLGYGYLQNQAGNFVNITAANIEAAANALSPCTPANERISLVDAPGANSYPIINYEYAMVSNDQNTTGMAQTLRTLLTWAVDPNHGSSPTFLDQVNFVPLPSATALLSLAQINTISGP
jgi:phosphate transport system substrate-binding protein